MEVYKMFMLTGKDEITYSTEEWSYKTNFL